MTMKRKCADEKKKKWNAGMHVKKSKKKGGGKEYSYKTFLFDRWINTMDF